MYDYLDVISLCSIAALVFYELGRTCGRRPNE